MVMFGSWCILRITKLLKKLLSALKERDGTLLQMAPECSTGRSKRPSGKAAASEVANRTLLCTVSL
jgi:hypothetical protein